MPGHVPCFFFCTSWGMWPETGSFHAVGCLGTPLVLLSSCRCRPGLPVPLLRVPFARTACSFLLLRLTKAGSLHRKIVLPDLGRVGLKKLAVRFEGCGEKRTFVENLKN